jgi:hypothetical protein
MSTALPIPKFGSFKPKKPAEAPSQPANGVSETKEHGRPRRDDDRESRRSTSRHTEHGHHRHHHHSRHHSRSRDERDEKERPAPAVDTPLVDGAIPLYVEDRRGDVQNLRYGSIHRYDVPAFHRVGKGGVLGAAKDIRMKRLSDDETHGIILTDQREDRESRREKYIFARNEKQGERFLKVRSDAGDNLEASDNLDFIALQISKPNKRARLEGLLDDSCGEDSDHYRSIEGKAKPKMKPVDEALEWATQSDSSDPEGARTIRIDEAMQKRNVELSRIISDKPENVEAWMALINHQDNMIGVTIGGSRKLTSAERRSLADIKLHMYEKALAKAGSNQANRERILLGMMAEGSKIWDFKTQSERWEQVSQENLDSILLWKKYLDFRQSNFSGFRHEEVRKVYVSRIQLLKRGFDDASLAVNHEAYLDNLIYTLLRATLYIREGGYSELAIAIWQGLLELNFLGPQSVESTQSRLERFQEFWDSEVPRIGEEGALGWLRYSPDLEAPDGAADEDIQIDASKDSTLFNAWATAEISKADASRMPARTLDDTTKDDPYRVILWSDIEDFMVDLSYDALKHLLLDAFLLFCRLPPLPTSYVLPSRQWLRDSFVRSEALEYHDAWIEKSLSMSKAQEDASVAPTVTEQEGPELDDALAWSFHSISPAAENLSTPMEWARFMLPWRASHSENNPIPYRWMKNAFGTLAESRDGELFHEYYLSFVFFNEPDNVKKTAKRLLKSNPSNLRLYNAYAMIEWARGNSDVAKTVYATALGMSLPGSGANDAILLWRSWAWALVEEGKREEALRVLISLPYGTDQDISRWNAIDITSRIKIMEAGSFFRRTFYHELYLKQWEHAFSYADCEALLNYLTSSTGKESQSGSQGDIAAALSTYHEISDNLSQSSKSSATIARELLLQSAARLLHHHCRAGPFRPSLVRETLSQYLTLFPHNTIFLSLYAWNEARLRIDDRVRTLLRDVVVRDPPPGEVDATPATSRLFAIRYELKHGNVHSVRAAFEKALAPESACASNPGLWRLYVLFCLAQERSGKLKRGGAVEMFYRGMRACPWCKDLYMLAFTTGLRDEMGEGELLAIYNVLEEKELRVRVDLGERLEEL